MFTEMDYLVQVERNRDARAFAERQRLADTAGEPKQSALTILQARIGRWVQRRTNRPESLGLPKPGPA